MTTPGRNEPCPCGSGKKYKKCCGRPASGPVDTDVQASAMGGALDFLRMRHLRAAEEALDCFLDPADEPEPSALDSETIEALEIARFEWLLAEAKLEVGGRWVSAYELLVGAKGPRLSTEHREALRELAERPRRLYEVTAVRPGETLTLRDVVTVDAEPVAVEEQEASRILSPGDVLASRLVRRQSDETWLVSGPLYAFPRAYLQPLREQIRGIEARCDPEEQRSDVSDVLTSAWVQYLTHDLPEVVHVGTDEDILLSEKAREAVGGRPVEPGVLPPDVRRQLTEDLYAEWGDVAIPALGDQTPQEAMATELGRERLTELLLDYEHMERRQSEGEKREPVSFDFLWRRVGLECPER